MTPRRQKIPFLSLLPRERMSRYCFENVFLVCKANTSTDKSAMIKNLQILAVTYDIGVLICAFDVV